MLNEVNISFDRFQQLTKIIVEVKKFSHFLNLAALCIHMRNY